ncbi:VWA domain-containing protein [Polynucleobacter paneuropaeus]|uniref:Magnesium chelatase ATPase subunit D n=1 Tax=Polynucleobacter paneuropaeus TaxID=2527775 RepID=A0A2Z4JRD0_9BURK|nr:VWA domain-containing protein [Polynucleobacter paneuropaeus]AWW49219.1 magnesium chelatase ATPase subunit D [Polynucleobacter paneuropaeus]MBT8562860.1 VWA domain-containing protein [Polynucleobacter paneuropaeus]QWD07030.1 VWA domain-containing protein [Polynucleobacter paneuropaeus]QWD21077.1 VWA domain-containing protein [Polynucleobacter paneuropaeus]QWD22848.1 VWA domain-containing protein [Polynucleobacter paneuropaeus]
METQEQTQEISKSAKLETWLRALQVAQLLVINPHGLGGVILRARSGPVRDRWLAYLNTVAQLGGMRLPLRKMPLGISDENLIGGIDLDQTLRTGKAVLRQGLLAQCDQQLLLMPMAERVEVGAVAKVVSALDNGFIAIERDGQSRRIESHFGVVALDEGIEDDEQPNEKIRQRMAFLLNLDIIGWRDLPETDDDFLPDTQSLDYARENFSNISISEDSLSALVGVAEQLGIVSIRALNLALNTAKCLAAFDRESEVSSMHLQRAIALVLSPRATRLPQSAPPPEEENEAPTDEEQADEQPEENIDQDQPPQPEPPPAEPTEDQNQDQEKKEENEKDEDESEKTDSENPQALDDEILEAAQAAIPSDLLARLADLADLKTPKGMGGKTGAVKVGRMRGRPLGNMPGMPEGGKTLSIIDTLRAAVPWQGVRRAEMIAAGKSIPAGKIIIRKEDFRIKSYQERTQTLTMFILDASGSSAMHRLAEAKGAVELLLAECYVRRDQVAVMSFRGGVAELVLAPTRSLVKAKRALSGLPGGGGTPLSRAIDESFEIASASMRKGLTPALVFLTDGRANIAKDGSPGRPKAMEDAQQSARAASHYSFKSLWIDTSPQARDEGKALAAMLGSMYLPLPNAGANEVSQAIMQGLKKA